MENWNDEVLIDRIDYGGGYYYIGEVKDGEANGKGAFYNSDGSISRKGSFKNGELNGYGELYVNGEKIYEGDFVDGKFHGNGIIYDKDGNVKYTGKFANGDIAYSPAPMKGNQWLTVSRSGGKIIADSYSLEFPLEPKQEDLKETIVFYMHYVDSPQDKLSALGLSAVFTSQSKKILELGGNMARLEWGSMIFHFVKGEDIILKPVADSSDIGEKIMEYVHYPLNQDTLKEICDREISEVNLTGDESRNWVLNGRDLTFLFRAAYNGIFDEKEYADYLKNFHAAPSKRISRVVLWGIFIVGMMISYVVNKENSDLSNIITIAAIAIPLLLNFWDKRRKNNS